MFMIMCVCVCACVSVCVSYRKVSSMPRVQSSTRVVAHAPTRAARTVARLRRMSRGLVGTLRARGELSPWPWLRIQCAGSSGHCVCVPSCTLVPQYSASPWVRHNRLATVPHHHCSVLHACHSWKVPMSSRIHMRFLGVPSQHLPCTPSTGLVQCSVLRLARC